MPLELSSSIVIQICRPLRAIDFLSYRHHHRHHQQTNTQTHADKNFIIINIDNERPHKAQPANGFSREKIFIKWTGLRNYWTKISLALLEV